jgi:hypothetical protein
MWLLCLEAVFVKGMACKPEDAVCEAVFVKGMARKPGDAVYEAAGRETFLMLGTLQFLKPWLLIMLLL